MLEPALPSVAPNEAEASSVQLGVDDGGGMDLDQPGVVPTEARKTDAPRDMLQGGLREDKHDPVMSLSVGDDDSDDLLALRSDAARSEETSLPNDPIVVDQPELDVSHNRKGDTDPLALSPGHSATSRQDGGVDTVKTEVEDMQDGVAGMMLANRSATRLVSPALSTGSSIQEVTLEEFNRSVPAFRSARPEGMTALEYLRSKRKAQATKANAPGSGAQGAISEPARTEAKPAPALKAIVVDDEATRASRAEWRRIVEEDGASDVEILLDTDADSHPSSASMTDVERDLNHKHLYDVTQIPPPDRRGEARRHFDSTVVDEWNALYENLSKKPALHRMIVSSYFHSKEPDSSEIPIHNEVDSEGVPPELEFEYSNDMLYGPDVPDPEKGLGCGCEGPCDEKSKTCSCLRRQQLYFYGLENLRGFAYNP